MSSTPALPSAQALARSLTGAIALLLVAACGHVPLTTMVKLSDFDLLTTSPEALRIAVKYPDSIRIPEEGARMRLTLEEKASGKTLLAEKLAFERIDTPSEKAELAKELETGWRIEIYRLPASRVPAFAGFQSRLAAMSKAERDTVNGSMEISVDGCLAAAANPDRIVVSTYLKAPELGGYVPLVRNADLKEMMADAGSTETVELEPCE